MKRPSKKHVNFLPKELRDELIFSKDFYYVAAFVVLCFIYTGLAIHQYRLNRTSLEEMSSLSNIHQIKVAEIEKLKQQLTEAEKLSETKNILKSLSAKRQIWGDHFKEISLLIPKGVWLSGMEVKSINGKVDIIIQGESLSYKDISQFYARLSQSINFSNLLINSSYLDTSESAAQITRFVFGTTNDGGNK